jgi:hypothetical protein
MAGCSPTDPDHMPPPWLSIELGIEGNNPLHLTGEEPQIFSYNWYRLGRDITELILDFLNQWN